MLSICIFLVGCASSVEENVKVKNVKNTVLTIHPVSEQMTVNVGCNHYHDNKVDSYRYDIDWFDWDKNELLYSNSEIDRGAYIESRNLYMPYPSTSGIRMTSELIKKFNFTDGRVECTLITSSPYGYEFYDEGALVTKETRECHFVYLDYHCEYDIDRWLCNPGESRDFFDYDEMSSHIDVCLNDFIIKNYFK